MNSRIKLAAFVSHYHGDAVLEMLLSMCEEFEIVLLATDDPLASYTNPDNRLWAHGWSPELRNLVRARARAARLETFTSRIKTRSFYRRFETASPDAIVSCVFGQRVPETLLRQVNFCAYNLHLIIAGRSLEATRGPKPIEKAVELGGGLLQVALHRMTHEFDRGEVLATSAAFPVWDRHHCSILEYYQSTAAMAAAVVRERLPGILRSDLRAKKPLAEPQTRLR